MLSPIDNGTPSLFLTASYYPEGGLLMNIGEGE